MRVYISGVFLALGLTIAGCSAGTSSNPPTPPTPPSPNIVVTAPHDGATIYGTPVQVSVTAANLSNASQLSVRLNGTDITSKLTAADANGVRFLHTEHHVSGRFSRPKRRRQSLDAVGRHHNTGAETGSGWNESHGLGHSGNHKFNPLLGTATRRSERSTLR
jgi:hypothetical protein